MTTTPTLWGANAQVNPSSTDFQGDHRIIGLSNGNHLVVFADDSGTIGTGAGRDIVGVIYGPTGTVVRAAFEVNFNGVNDEEELPAIAADNNGGFYMAYEDRDANGQRILIERFDDNGDAIAANTVQIDPGTPLVSAPSIAVSVNGNVMVSYQWSDGADDNARAKLLDSNLTFIEQGAGGNGVVLRTDDNPLDFTLGVFDPETAALTNGNFVTVYREPDNGEAGIELRGTDGTTGSNSFNVNVGTTGNNGVLDYDPQIAALTGGGFVVVWVEDDGVDDNIMYAIYANTGGQVKAPAAVVDLPNTHFAPDVVALKDGGFFIANADFDTDTIVGTRYDAAGNQVGLPVLTLNFANSPTDPELGLTSDGRILLSWTDGSGDIFKEIWDPRDDVIIADGTEGVITARSTEATSIIGSDEDEEFIGQGFFNHTISGGFGDDTIRGGPGSDTADYSYSTNPGGAVPINTWNIDLLAGTATRSVVGLGVQETDTLISIENVIGSGWNDTITGSNGSNTLSGEDGNDSILGGISNDTLSGGEGNDTLLGGFGTDDIDGGAGNDLIILGNGENIDNVDGGADTDTLDASAEDGTAISVTSMVSGTWTGIGGTRSISGIEHLIGTQLGDALNSGNVGNVTIEGGDGDDTINGGGGDQTLMGGDGEDVIVGGMDGDSIDGGDDNDLIIDNSGANTLSGGDGDDVFELSNGSLSNQTLNGGIGSDTVDYSSVVGSSATFVVGFDIDQGYSSDGATFSGDWSQLEGLIGIQNYRNDIVGNASDNSLTGGYLGDTISGEAGNDTIIGRLGNDSIDGGDDADILWGDDLPVGLLRLNEGVVVDQYLEATTFDAIPTDAFTVEWLFQSFGPQDNDASFVSYATSTVANNEFLVFGASGGEISVFVNGNQTFTGVDTDTVFDGDVHRMSVSVDTADGTNGRISLYIDGVEVFSGPGLNAGVGAPIEAGGTFIIGQDQDSVGGGFQTTQALQGRVGDIRVWSEERTQAEIDDTIFTQFKSDDLPGNPSLVANWQVDPDSGALSALTGTQTLDRVSAGANPFTADSRDIQDDGGNDTINGGDGADEIFGGSGNDSIDGGIGADSIEGGAGNDTLLSGQEIVASDTLRGGAGDDVLEKQSGTNGSFIGTFDGGDDTDLFFYSASGSGPSFAGRVVDLSAGRILFNGADRDILIDIENVRVAGDAGIVGDGNDNHLSAVGDGANRIDGRFGNDTIDGGGGADRLFGGGGIDSILGGAGNDYIEAGNESDETVRGGDGNDTIEVIGGGLREGNADNDIFIVNDSFFMSDVDPNDGDLFDGGSGTDLFDASNETSLAFTIDLLSQTIFEGGDANRTVALVNFENATGGQLGDTITGNALANVLRGEAGDDTIHGGAGADRVFGDAGADRMFGDAGADRMFGGGGADSLNGGNDTDILIGETRGIYHTDVSAQVFRMFAATLGREPGVDGHQAWAQQLAIGAITLDGMASGFVGSPEFQNTYGSLDNAQFVTLLFNNVLGREPNTAGLTGWVNNIESGMSRAEVVRRFSESAEHVIRTAPDQQAFDATHDPTEWVDDVYRLFRAVFDREPGEAGFTGWVDNLSSGRLTFDEVVVQFMASAEFQTTYGNTSNMEFVELLFNNVLGRPGAPAGVTGWTNNLDAGMSREEVVQLFMSSPEFVIRTEADLRSYVAGFGPDDVLDPGAGDAVVSGGLFADTFVFTADAVASTVTVTDLEVFDTLRFTGFGLNAAQIRGQMTQDGDDVVFVDGTETIIFANTALADITEAMITIA